MSGAVGASPSKDVGGVLVEKRKSYHISLTTSIAARGGGGSFKRLKLYNSEEHLPIEFFCDNLDSLNIFF